MYDNRWILSWSIMAAGGCGDFHTQLRWLAGIVQTRGYPVQWLARDLEIAAEVTVDALTSASDPVRIILLSGAGAVRAR